MLANKTCLTSIRRAKPVTDGSNSGSDLGVFDRLLQAIATDLQEGGGLDLSECFTDGTFTSRVPGVQKRGAKGGCQARVPSG